MQSGLAARLRGDLFGGVTAGIVALPLALAFGVASGAGAAAGLYGAMVLGFFAAVFGGTPTQISGPTGPMTVVTAAALVAFQGDLSSVMMAVALSGVLQMVLGVIRVGRFVRFIPYPVISGFMSGIGVIIILLQIHPLLGAHSVSSPLQSVLTLGPALAQTSLSSLFLGALAMAIVFLTPARISRVLPSPLIALIAGTLVSVILGLDVATIGSIPQGLPELHLPAFNPGRLREILGYALALAVLGTMDTLLTSLVADSMTKERHNPNRELLGQGLGNMLCGLVGGIPGAGATMRTVVNIKAGGTTRLAGAVHAVLLLAVLLGLGPLASRIPMPVLAGILVKVGVDILDYRMLGILRRAPRQDLAVMVTVFAITVFVDLIVAVAAGVTLASLLLTYRITRQSSIDIQGEEEFNGRLSEERGLQAVTDFAVRVVTVSGPFFFGTSASMQDAVAKLAGTRVLVINCLKVPFMDLSAIFALGEMVERMRDARVAVLLAVTDQHRKRLLELGFGALLPEDRMYTEHEPALAEALRLAEEDLRAARAAEHRPVKGSLQPM
jgi:SulP family sulfate permease